MLPFSSANSTGNCSAKSPQSPRRLTMDPSELRFPVECHFRIIAENHENMHFVIETVLMGLGVTSPLVKGNETGSGKYASFRVSTVVHSREAMNRIDQELR